MIFMVWTTPLLLGLVMINLGVCLVVGSLTQPDLLLFPGRS